MKIKGTSSRVRMEPDQIEEVRPSSIVVLGKEGMLYAPLE